MKIFKKQSGFTVIEILLVIAIIGLLVAYAAPRFGLAPSNSQIKVITDDVDNIVQGSRGWKGYNRPYTGVSITQLSSMKLVPEYWGDGVGVNPAGGNYTVAAGNPNNRFVITVTNLDDGICLAVRKNVLAGTVSGSTASCSSGTLSATFE